MKIILKLNLLLFFFTFFPVYTADFLKQFVKTDPNHKFILGVREEKKELLDVLKKEQEEINTSQPVFIEKTSQKLNEIQSSLNNIEGQLQKNPDDDFLIKQQSLLRELEQIVRDTQRTREDNNSLITELISQLQNFIDDSQFESFKKKNKLNERLHYSFDDLQILHDQILDYEQQIVQLIDQEKSIRIEKEGRKRTLSALQEEHDKRTQDVKTFTDALILNSGLISNIDQEKEILKLEDSLYKYKKKLAEVSLKKINYQLRSIETQLFIVRSQLDLLKKHLRMVKSAIHVNEADVALAEEDLAKEQKTYFSHKDSLRLNREKIVAMHKAIDKELHEVSKQASIPLSSDVNEWTKKPRQTSDSYVAFVHIGALNAEAHLYSKERDLLDAYIALEEEKFNYKKLKTEAKTTYHKISTHGFLTEEEITRERTEYEARKKNAEEASKLYQTKINALSNSLNKIKKILDRVNTFREDAERQSDLIFKNKVKERIQFNHYLVRADKALQRQIDIVGKLTGTYSGVISEINSTIRLIDFISTELQASTIWYRPAYAITLEGVKNSFIDIKAFFNDIRLYITKFNSRVLIIHLGEIFSRPFTIVFLLVFLLILILFFYIIGRYQERITSFLLLKSKEYGVLANMAGFIVATLLLFVSRFRQGIFCWIMLFIICSILPDAYLFMLFHLLSIPYLLYLSHYYIKFVGYMNVQYKYVLLSEDFQRRFEIVFSPLIYLTIIIFFFRQAFMLSIIHTRSELSNILLAGNFIILQISLIFLISKEQIMGIIPDYSDFWRWVHTHVDHYYYLLLFFVIAIIIMSNPYVGFGRLVLYLLSGFFYMALLIKLLSFLHEFVKKATSFLFFSQEDSIIRERFSYAKTCFGLVIIASFVVLGFIGFIGAAKIWGFGVALGDFHHWLQVPLLLDGTTHPITTLSLLKIIAFILGGFAIAYALKQYVLARIFDLLFVESGVQYTVTSIVQYLVIIIAIFFAFNSVGLGSLIGHAFIGLALTLGLYMKEPISDFISYFIILVQRPVKIGDYVQIDSETIGVVRQITPRSVILRRKNSTTIIVPNSYVMSKSIENWNYVRNFVALSDIYLSVYFKEDPHTIKKLLLAAIDEHHNILKNPKPIIRLSNFTETGYEFMVRCFISSAYTLEMWEIASDIRFLIAKTFKDNTIDFAVPFYKVDDGGMHLQARTIKDAQNNPQSVLTQANSKKE